MNTKKLIQELISSGASAQEASALVEFENSLNKPLLERSPRFKQAQIALLLNKVEKKNRFDIKRLFAPLSIAAAGFSLVTVSAFASQNSIPGDPLYALKRISEKVLQTVNPKFDDQLPVRRSEEVKKLIESNKTSDLIKKTIEDYKETKKDSPKSSNSTQARDNLKQAEEKATGETKIEIKKVLDESKVEGASVHENSIRDQGNFQEKNGQPDAESNENSKPEKNSGKH